MKLARIVISLTVLAVAIAGTSIYFVHVRRSHDIIRGVFGGRQAFDAFLSARDVTAERLHSKTGFGSPNLADYRRDSSVSLSPEQVEEVRHLFIQHSSFTWRGIGPLRTVKACLPAYGVLITFRSTSTVQIALCFQCDQFGVFFGDGDSAPRVNLEEDLDLFRPHFVTLVQEIYPKDPAIQSLTKAP